jgi:Putative Ig domain
MLSRAVPPPAQNTQRYQRVLWFALMSALLSIAVHTADVTAAAQATPRGSSLVISGTPPAAVVGVSYNSTLSASGGTAPYTFSISRGQLPPGLTLGKTTGTISGSPTKSGTYNFGVHATDSSRKSVTQAFRITVSEAPNVIVTVTPPIATVISAGTVQFSALVTNTSNTTAGTEDRKLLDTADIVREAILQHLSY